ncbi:uncharacterized protein LOC126796753 [Argentina anserina]|uniref:uncharacterized protein LOC126796753 n=1 Tax=Argentina anserina TaxID=57926 RepID=UPI0021765FBF|nr:uncharacterized protein LOC126796753 [Potentilla anserina]
MEDQCKVLHEMKLKDLKAKGYLFQAIDRSIMDTIMNKQTAKGIWDSMRQKYHGTTKVKRAQLQALRREFELLGMKEGEKVDDYFARTLTVVNKMKAHDEKMEDLMIIEKILRSMTAKFDYVVCSIEESNNLTTMSIAELQSSLLVHEQRMFNRAGGEEQNECPDWEKYAHCAELMTHVELNNARREEVWFLHSGFSNHMTGNKEWFTLIDEQFRQSVKLDNNSKMTVFGRGNVRLHVDGITQVITDVYYMPELKNNLLSIGQLQEKGGAILI